MRKSPRESAGFFSKLFFSWTIPLLRLGNQKELVFEDFPKCSAEDSAQFLSNALSEEWNAELTKHVVHQNQKDGLCRRPSLLRALIRTFGLRFGISTLVQILVQAILRPGACIAMGYVLRYFSGEYSNETGWLCAAVLMGTLCIVSILTHPSSFESTHIGMNIRVAVSNLVFKKALRLNHGSLSQSSVGHRINLLSNDVNRYDRGLGYLPNLFICPVLLLVTPCILWNYIGPSCLPGVAILVLLGPFQGLVGRVFGRMRTQIGALTDSRIGLVSQVLNGLLLIKMSAWELPFMKTIAEARESEMWLIRKKGCLMALNFSTFHITTKGILLLTFVIYILTGNELTAEKVFVTLSVYSRVSFLVAQMFPMAIAGMAEILASTKRIEEMLLLEERPDSNVSLHHGNQNSAFVDDTNNWNLNNVRIEVQGVVSKWSPSDEKRALDEISLSGLPGQLIGITGPSGSGKSSLLHCFLQELPVEAGTVQVSGRVAYAPQDPWLFPGDIRSNILMGQGFDEDWYKLVVSACALTRDFSILPLGDRTVVGDNGVRLSGGQKARVNLARAVYADADVYLLDDPLSAVDARVGRHLMEKCISGLLKSKLVILVTHQVHYLEKADEIIRMVNGAIAERGTYEFLNSNNVLKNTEHMEIGEFDGYDDTSAEEFCEVPLSDTKMSAPGNSEPEVISESNRTGLIGFRIYWQYLRAGNSILCIVLLLSFTIFAQALDCGLDYLLKQWTAKEQLAAKSHENITMIQESTIDEPMNMNYITVYSGMLGVLYIANFVSLQLIFNLLASSSVKLHHALSRALIRAPMSFFSLNTMGRILNRFSNDMGNVDEGLPTVSYIVSRTMLEMLGAMSLVSILNPLMLVPSLGLVLVALLLARFYLRFSVSAKRMEASCRSQVFSEISTSAHGLTTIRAFKAEEVFKTQFLQAVDNHTAVFYTFLASARWFCLVLDWLCNLYYAGLILALFLAATGSAEAGLALTVGMALAGQMTVGLTLLAELENEMVSAERILDYSKLEPEAPLNLSETKPPESWPAAGELQIDNVAVRYGTDAPFLQDVKMSIKAGEKIGIVGRTGSGKSTLVRSLFRIMEPCSGNIQIDGIDVGKIGLHDLRSKISIIPQNPVLFTGTIRFNLDPFGQFSDDRLWAVLEQVQLRQRLKLASDVGLETNVNERGSNFSQGEIQLICMARAILSKNKILVLDEATANIDSATDAIIQKTIRECFAECTVLTIAHRLDTVMDSDRICVMDAGRIAEFDTPHNLLQNPLGQLYKLVSQTGANGTEILTTIARNKFEQDTLNRPA